MKLSIPADTDKCPIAVIGGGTLGRRIALMMSSRPRFDSTTRFNAFERRV